MPLQDFNFNHTVLNALAAHIAVLDRKGTIIDVNDAWRRFARGNHGSKAVTKGVSLNYLDVCRKASGPSSEGAQECLEGLQALLAGSIDHFELEYPCHSPFEERWFLLRAVPWRQGKGGAVVSHINISERRRMEEALRRSEERFRLLVDCIEDYAIFMLDAVGRIISWNEGAEHIYGYSETEILGQHYGHLFSADDIQKGNPEQTLSIAAASGRINLENWQFRKGQKSFWANVTLTAMRDSRDILMGFSMVTRDLTERKQAERITQRSQQQAEIIASLGQQALVSTELGELMNDTVNQIAQCLDVEFCQILELLPNGHGFLLRAGTGWQKSVIGHAHIPGERQSHAGYTLLTNTPVIVENMAEEIRFTPSSLFREQGVISGVNVVIHGQQRPFGILGVHTLRRRLFTQDDIHFLQAAAHVLAAVVERKRSEEILIQAQKMQAVGQLTSGVAHDFNNMLTIIIGNLQIIEGRVKGDALLDRFIKAALEGARSGANLVNKLLTFSRRQSLQPQRIDVNRQITNLTALLNRTLGETVEIAMALDEALWRALVDPNQLETALLNLALNARDAMPSGGKLTIETANVTLAEDYAARETELTPGQYVMLAVSDTGVGMTSEVAGRVFEPFFTTKETGKGSGLGLSMVYGFAKQSGGHIKIYSEPGYGTTVKLYLPRALEVKEAAPASPSPPRMRSTHGETVLVVEDETGVRELAVRFLSELGYRVLEADNGLTAQNMVEQGHEIDLLFVDVVLPGGISGPQLAQIFQQYRPHGKVLFASGYTKNNATTLHEQLEKDAPLLSKPYGKEELARLIRAILNGDTST